MLDGKVIMIAGASSGIGAAAARLFAAEGAQVVLMARREERIQALAEELTASGAQASACAGDVTRPDDVARVVTSAVKIYGRLDGAFNNAGWATAGTRLHEDDEADFHRVLEVNLLGVWNCLRQQIPAMLDSGTGGSIVNTSSHAGVAATGASAAYVAAKHAVLGLTKAAAADYGRDKIRVNALVVGATRTELMEEVISATPALEEAFTSRSAQQRMAAPAEVAQAAAWLLSDRSSFVTGSSMAVDGGATAL
ncbi:glucose 1-dehydrogenase [Streptomyces sp. H27-C3]|uniref:SDR family NAD(P)-dependent oxidoreductase n=1 Tax=Streptomyces sp. H27-C3 TaxID=3046305 RepID=UPI0024BB77CF|nr:glucose 1-dehydrogenase [Streptomyces sp. H27-C3]MDJ0466756.1 glucose 1-dehydrogenase [Streptomyces sp. H27-C3]